MSRATRETRETRARAQVVLVAAGVIAVALVPMALAYLQLGYHADVHASGAHAGPGVDARRVLDHAVHNASTGVDGEYSWHRRSAAISDVNETLWRYRGQITMAHVDRGTVYELSRNETAAANWADARCPRGPTRQFGRCEAANGMVVQNRTDETTVLVVAYDVRISDDRGAANLTFVIHAIGGTGAR